MTTMPALGKVLDRPASPGGSTVGDRDTAVDSSGPTVWMVVASFAPAVGGAEAQAHNMAKELRSRGWPVRVLTRRHRSAWQGPAPPSREVMDGVPVQRVWSRGPGRLGSATFLLSSLWHLGRHGRRGIYHAHDTGTAAGIAAVARRLFRGHSVVKLRSGRAAYERETRGTLARRLFRRRLLLHDRLLVVNREVEAYAKELGVPAHRIRYVPNSVDGRQFRTPEDRARKESKEHLGYPPHRPLVIYVGRLHPVKGVDVLIEAWAILAKRLSGGGTLAVVGDGPSRGELERRAAMLRVRESISFEGERSDVTRFYRAADLFVLPSRSEGLSNAFMEALSCGVPIVASDVGGASDLLSNGFSSGLVPAENPASLAREMGKRLEDPAGHRARARILREKVMAFMDVRAVAKELERIYLELGRGGAIGGGR